MSKSLMVPQSLGEAMEFAKQIASSELVPKNYRNKPSDIVGAIMYGAELGLSPFASLQSVAVINGKACVYSDGLLAICQRHPKWAGKQERSLADITKTREARCIIKRAGEPDAEATFSFDNAKTAKLLGKDGPWQTYPERMLQWRARGFALRDQFADALKGVISAEEAQDYPDVQVAENIEHPPIGDVKEKTFVETPEEFQQATEEMETATSLPPKEETHPEEKPSPIISEAQRRRMYGVWKSAGRKDDDVKEWLLSEYGFASTSDVTKDKYKEICEKLEGPK